MHPAGRGDRHHAPEAGGAEPVPRHSAATGVRRTPRNPRCFIGLITLPAKTSAARRSRRGGRWEGRGPGHRAPRLAHHRSRGRRRDHRRGRQRARRPVRRPPPSASARPASPPRTATPWSTAPTSTGPARASPMRSADAPARASSRTTPMPRVGPRPAAFCRPPCGRASTAEGPATNRYGCRPAGGPRGAPDGARAPPRQPRGRLQCRSGGGHHRRRGSRPAGVTTAGPRADTDRLRQGGSVPGARLHSGGRERGGCARITDQSQGRRRSAGGGRGVDASERLRARLPRRRAVRRRDQHGD